MWVDDGDQGDTAKKGGFWGDIFKVASPGQSGSWSFDRPTLQQITKEWELLADDCLKARENSRPMAQIVGPGLDPASTSVAAKANMSGEDYRRMLSEMRKYAEAQAQACRKALGEYVKTEDEHKSFFEKYGLSDETGSNGGVI